FAPIMDFRALVGLGPRIAEHALDAIPLHAFPAWEDVRLKGENAATAGQPPAPAGPTLATSTETASGEASDGADTASDQAAFVVLAGVVSPHRLQKSITGYRNVPNVRGFSVQSTPKKTLTELAAAGGFANGSLSVTTVRELK